MLAATVLGSGMAFLDGTVVNVALPTIGEDLDAGMAGLQWIVNGYMLTLASLILLGGSLGDRFGRRRVFVIGVVWFAVASMLCAVAPTSRCSSRPGPCRASAARCSPRAAWPSCRRRSGPPTARGDRHLVRAGRRRRRGRPVRRRRLVDSGSWRLIFLINAPLAVVVVLVLAGTCPRPATRDATGSSTSRRSPRDVGLAGLTYGLIGAGDDGFGPRAS